MSLFSKISEDLKTYEGNWAAQGFWAMVVYRFGQWRYSIKNSLVRKFFSLLYKFFYKVTQVITGIELPCEVQIGKGLRIDHFGGIVISGYTKIGDYCVIRNGVTIGLKNVSQPVAPRIGSHVDIGSGAKILGDITIGNSVTIGANAVVLNDVPDGATAVGVPARIILKK